MPRGPDPASLQGCRLGVGGLAGWRAPPRGRRASAQFRGRRVDRREERGHPLLRRRDLERYFDLAGCHGDERERARALAPHDASAQIGWYVLRKPGF